MDRNVLVSVIIPVYNSEATICRCLDSLINQTYDNFEIICVNDSSTDGSLSILREYEVRDSRIMVINHKENINAGGARNSGIKASKGHYICFVDNDDWLNNKALELLINASDNGNADLVASDWITYYSETKQIVNKNLIQDIIDDNEIILNHVCHHGFRMLGCLWKTKIIKDHKLFFPERIFYEDNAIFLTMFCYAKKIKYVQFPLYYYFMSPFSVTGSKSPRKIKDRITTTEMCLSNLSNHGFYKDHKELFDYYCLRLCHNTLYSLIKYPIGEIKEDLYRNNKIIKHCLPNQIYSQIGPYNSLIFYCPKLTYYLVKYHVYFFNLYIRIKNVIVH